ncbi:MAG: serine/threonine-protein kinase [Acidobacteriota bacterium]
MDTPTVPGRHSAAYPPTETDAALPTGARVGRFLLLHLAGRGGMGEVYAAYDPELERKIALKFLLESGDEGEEQERLRREARAMARLQHPHVITIYDVGSYGGRLFVAMEFIAGTTLASWLGERQRDWREILPPFLQAAQGLAAAHAVGVVHQDFKPSNVMLGPGGARVVDFGLAAGRFVGSSGEAPLGTPAYMAPERRAGRPADARSDQYSFAVALGRALEQASGRVPRWLRRVIEIATASAPSDRFVALDDLLAEIARGRRRGRRRVALAAGLFVVLLVGGLAFRGALVGAPSLCSGGAERLVEVWGEGPKGEIERAFAASQLPFAGQTFALVEAAGDRYARQWRETYEESCRATHVLGEQSERLLDLRMQCLTTRLAEFRGLLEAFVQADAAVVSNSTRALLRLTPVESCSDLVLLHRLPDLPANVEARRELETARTAVARARAGRLAGREPPEMVLDRALAVARRHGYTLIESEALFEQALREPDPGRATELLDGALRAAISADARALEADSYLELMNQLGFFQSRYDKGVRFGLLAEAALRTLGDGHADRWTVYHVGRGNLEFRRGQLAEARQHYLRAHRVAREAGIGDDPRRANLYTNLGITEGPGEAAQEAALEYLTRAVEIQEAAYGAGSPQLGPALINLAGNHASHGRYGESLRLALRCLENQLGYFRRDHRDMGYPLLLMAQIYNAAGRPERAEPYLRRAETLVDEKLVENVYLGALTRLTVSETALELGQWQRAWAAQRLAAQAYREGLSDHHSFALSFRLQSGRLHLADGDLAAALEWLAAIPGQATSSVVEQRDRWRGLLALGQARLRAGERDAALGLLEEAVETVRPGIDLHLAAEAREALAEALAGDDPDRSTALLQQARRDRVAHPDLEGHGVSPRVGEWLAQNGRPPGADHE